VTDRLIINNYWSGGGVRGRILEPFWDIGVPPRV